MTNAVFYRKGIEYRGFSLNGHACFNTSGPDILCSAISMASQMTALGLEEVARVNAAIVESDGSLEVKIKGNVNKESQTLIRSFYLAMENLCDQYPEFITLTQIDWSE